MLAFKSFGWGLVTVSVAALSVANPAFAQQADDDQERSSVLANEIVVTAQKREQSAQDVGIAVTTFSGEQIDALGFESSIDVTRFSPGVYTSSTSGGQNNQFTIRGVSQNDFLDAVEAPVAVYIDDGYVATQNGQTFGLFDIERVEVLKGPQGTLFGRNATGGLVHFISRKPTDITEGFVDLTYGTENQVTVEAAVGGPISDDVGFRIAGYFNRHDPILTNNFPQQALNVGGPVAGGGQDLFNDRTWGLRGHLEFKPTGNLTVLLTGFASKTTYSTSPYQNTPTIAVVDANGAVINTLNVGPGEVREAIGPGGINVDVDGFGGAATRPVPGGDFFGFLDPDGSEFTTSSDFAFDDLNSLETYGATGQINLELGAVTLTSVTDFKKYKKFNVLDVDGSATDWFQFASSLDAESFTQEIRLSGDSDRLRWVVGGYLLDIDNDTDTGFLFSQSTILTDLAGIDNINQVRLDTQSYSLFGQFEYDLTDTLTLVAGLRGGIEKKQFQLDQTAFVSTDDRTIDTDTVAFSIAPQFTSRTNDFLWSGKIQFDWRPVDDVLLYAGVNRGVKAGSFNAPITFFTGTPTNLLPYQEEVLVSYEAGFKTTIFDGTTRFNGAAYYYDYDGYQASVFAGLNQVIQNRDATIKGFELELSTNPVPGLDVLLNLGYVDAEIKNLQVAPNVARDVRPTFVPELTFAGLVRYEFQTDILGGRVAIQGDANYASNFFHNARNFDAQRFDGYWLTNARISWKSNDDIFEISGSVENIADTRNGVVGFDLAANCGCTINAYGKPRWYSLSLRYNF